MGLILIADDNPHAHRMGRQILSQEGHDVVTVSSGDEAMEYLRENKPDLVMVDTRMPGPSGYEVCKHVKHDSALEGVKAVLLAGPLEPFDSEQAEQAGSDAVLHKPLDAFTLIDTVNSLIGKPTPLNGSGVRDHVEGLTESDEDAEAPATAEPAAQETAAEVDEEEIEEPAAPEIPEDIDDLSASDGWNSAERPASPEELDEVRRSVQTAVAAAPPQSKPGAAQDDPFADLVREVLTPADQEAARREHIRAAVRETLEAAMPALVDALTDRVLERTKQD